MKESSNILDFFKRIETYFIDYIMRSLDVSELVLNFNKKALSH
jgi:hypothetical protein